MVETPAQLLKAFSQPTYNREGRRVCLGSDLPFPEYVGGDKLYCGGACGNTAGDGYCGPSAGPQCNACIALTRSAEGRALIPVACWTNSEGRKVCLGSDILHPGDNSSPDYTAAGKFFCGKALSYLGRNKRCGPTQGQQCGSCKEFTARAEGELGNLLPRVERPGQLQKAFAELVYNRAGRQVCLGSDLAFPGHRGANKFYCGYECENRESDGYCGPAAGAQCDACTAFTESPAGRALIPQTHWSNSEGVRVCLGSDIYHPEWNPDPDGTCAGKFFCGRSFSSERCGPTRGWQCTSCREFTSRAREEDVPGISDGAQLQNPQNPSDLAETMQRSLEIAPSQPQACASRNSPAPPLSEDHSGSKGGVTLQPPNRRESEEADRLECKICLHEQIQSVAVPCGHSFACWDCIQALDHCSICRGKIAQKIRMYI